MLDRLAAWITVEKMPDGLPGVGLLDPSDRPARPDDPIWAVWIASLVVMVLLGSLVVLALGGFPRIPEGRRRTVGLVLLAAVVALLAFMVVWERIG